MYLTEPRVFHSLHSTFNIANAFYNVFITLFPIIMQETSWLDQSYLADSGQEFKGDKTCLTGAQGLKWQSIKPPSPKLLSCSLTFANEHSWCEHPCKPFTQLRSSYYYSLVLISSISWLYSRLCLPKIRFGTGEFKDLGFTILDHFGNTRDFWCRENKVLCLG